MGENSEKGLFGAIVSIILIAVVVLLFIFLKMPIWFIIGLIVVGAIFVVVIVALVIAALVISAKEASKPTRNRENKNPYSATNEGLKNRMINSSEVNYETFVKEAPGVEKLIVALKKLNIEPRWFMRIYERSKPRDATEGLLQLSQKWIFADVVSELASEGYINYVDSDNLGSVVDKLNKSAKIQGLALLEGYDVSGGPEEGKWEDSLKIISSVCSLWKIFVLDVNSAEAYVGVVANESQVEFVRLLKEYIQDFGIEYTVYSI